MTFHRFIYKIVWKRKLIGLLIFLITALALLTTLLHGHLLPGSIPGPQIPPRGKLLPRFQQRHEGGDKELGAGEVQGDGDGGGDGGVKDIKKDVASIQKEFVEDARKKALQMFQEQPVNPIEISPNKDILKFSGGDRRAKRPKEKQLEPFHNTELSYDPKSPPEAFYYWRASEEKFCGGQFSGFFHEFAQLRDVIFDMKFCHGRKGGERIQDVLMQDEEVEFYTYDMGCMRLKCPERPDYFFNNKNHLTDLLYSLKTKHYTDQDVREQVTTGLHLLVTRYEYANIYHTMTDWYNAFLLMNFFNQTQAKTNILLADGHPQGSLDPVWNVLFNSSRRLSDLQPVTKYKQLTFNILGYNSHFLDHEAETIPMLDEFATFFLNSYRVEYNKKTLDCDKVSVLFIWRRDYLAHPRKPSGEVSRKIANERELIDFLQLQYPDFDIKGVQIDLFDMQHQLRYVTEADVIIGMHGAGLTHAIFLPKHGGLIELIPNYWSAAMEHFMAIARWKQLKYERWVNTDPHNEGPKKYTKIPTTVLNILFRSLLRQMGCLPAVAEEAQQKAAQYQDQKV